MSATRPLLLLVLAAGLAATVLLRAVPLLPYGSGDVLAPRSYASSRKSTLKGLESVRGAPLLFVSFANAAFFDMLLNWSHAVARLGVPYYVGALDAKCAWLAAQHGLPHGLLTEVLREQQTVGSANFRTNLTVFRGMGALKARPGVGGRLCARVGASTAARAAARAAARLGARPALAARAPVPACGPDPGAQGHLVRSLLRSYGVQTLVVSDTDTVWLRNPSDYLAKHPLADWFISTDCLSHEVRAA